MRASGHRRKLDELHGAGYLLVPTLRVGTHVRTLCVPLHLRDRRLLCALLSGTQSVPTCVPTRSVGTRIAAQRRECPLPLGLR